MVYGYINKSLDTLKLFYKIVIYLWYINNIIENGITDWLIKQTLNEHIGCV